MGRTSHVAILPRPALLLALAISGCAIADSTVVDLRIPTAPGTVACNSALGSYALPKSYVRVVIGQEAGKRPDLVTSNAAFKAGDKFEFDIIRRADPALTICLDYLSSVFAHDEIDIEKQSVKPDGNSNNDGSSKITSQFLRSIKVNATDRSVKIARNLIGAAFVGLSGNPDFGNRSVTVANPNLQILADIEFDPFDTYAAAGANARLSRLGFCLVLEGFSFDRESLSVDQYCNSPYRTRNHLPRAAELYALKSREPIPPNTPGVLYRPRQVFLISVYHKDDRAGRGQWHLNRRVDVHLENLSPVISVGISRAMFARRNAALLFDAGTLRTVCIAKTSEIENFVAIPFEIARSLVALPTQIVQVKINRIAREEELARVEDQFIKTQAALIKTQLEKKAQPGLPGVPKADTPTPTSPLLFGTDAPKPLAQDANTFFSSSDAALKQRISEVCESQLNIGALDPNIDPP